MNTHSLNALSPEPSLPVFQQNFFISKEYIWYGKKMKNIHLLNFMAFLQGKD